MDTPKVTALASELELTLGLLRGFAGELKAQRAAWGRFGRILELASQLADRTDLAELPAVLLRAHAEIGQIRGGLRLARETIEASAVLRIRDSQHSLVEVTATTENATTAMMNGLDRSLALLDRLEGQPGATPPAEGFRDLRHELTALYNHLQFQDITTQQLQGVIDALFTLEARVNALAALFDTPGEEQPSPAPHLPVPGDLPYNADATMKRSIADQAAIDAAFRGARGDSHALDAKAIRR